MGARRRDAMKKKVRTAPGTDREKPITPDKRVRGQERQEVGF